MKTDNSKYDYIIAGSGCAGLSLLYGLLNDPILKDKKILVLDKNRKNKNDRTWCFWEMKAGPFEEVVFHRWNTLEFLDESFTKKFELEKYSYKMIQGIDYYNFVLNHAKGFENVVFKCESIQSIKSDSDRAFVETDQSTYSGTYVFNSTRLFHPEMNTENSLLQHFEGWVIKVKNPVFDSDVGTLMDFRLSQKNGTTFMYVLPTSPTEALVEYTLFSKKVLEKEVYKTELEKYIQDYLKIDSYEITHKEFGIIPMSTASFSRNTEKRIINLGTAGGQTKASSGYTFQFIQKNTSIILENLRNGNFPNQSLSFRDKMYQWYDRTLIEVILSGKMEGKEIFSVMFRKLNPEMILAFLANESTFLEELQIMNSLPKGPFFTSGIKQL
ncbi:lycopene cyclase [Cryomorpha ignava]|uniref:Lycopene cyclase n=1 Tax=Cryomorpha ignava TaxID=101383 RepID=A0A7K3WU50_9FLAO|nr:lycopene cyclase family protein [Cryomorpha ignava]NEN25207.1 lycopene cyclase [Cryomorpha ignava]